MFKKLLSLIFWLTILTVYAHANNDELIIKPINERMYVYTTFKEISGTKYSSNAMYILTKDGAILLDAPWDSEQYQTLVDHIKNTHNKDIIALFVTHAHDDRAGGLQFFNELGIPSYAYTHTNKILKETHQAMATNELGENEEFTFDQQKLMTSFIGAGHTLDNIIIWLPEEKLLYGACLIKSAESQNLGYIKDGDVQAWQTTIEKIQQKYSDAKIVIPGHDEWDLNHHIEHTSELLKGALNADNH
ncbi:MAG: BlaB/IND/MUS family subclass B1 metallo-beta-lactamase [Wohlfahrtiimonas sp.]